MKLIVLRNRMEQATFSIRQTAAADPSLLRSLQSILDYSNALEAGLAAELMLDEWLNMDLADDLIPSALTPSGAERETA